MQITPVNLIKNLTSPNFGAQSKVRSNIFLKNNKHDSFSFTGDVKPQKEEVAQQTLSVLSEIEDKVDGIVGELEITNEEFAIRKDAKLAKDVIMEAYAKKDDDIPHVNKNFMVHKEKYGMVKVAVDNRRKDGTYYSAVIDPKTDKIKEIQTKKVAGNSDSQDSKYPVIRKYHFDENGKLETFEEIFTEGEPRIVVFSKEPTIYTKQGGEDNAEVALNPDGSIAFATFVSDEDGKYRKIQKTQIDDETFCVYDSSINLFDCVKDGKSNIQTDSLGAFIESTYSTSPNNEE